MQPRVFIMWIGVLVSTLIALFLIKYFNIAYPVDIRTSQVSSELSVVGEGKVDVKPDSAIITAGFSITNAASAQEAQQKVDSVSNSLVASLTKLGISKDDIKTSNYSVSPNYSYDPSGQKANGFNADVSYTVTVKKIDILPQVLTDLTAAGATQVNSVNYSVNNPEKYREDARNMAIQNARDQAQKLASQLGIHLGRVTNIVESGSNSPGPIPYIQSDMKSLNSGGGVPQPNIQPGTETVSSTVTLYFEKN